MRYLAVVLAVLCGIALVIKAGTGTLDPGQIAGIGVILLAIAFFLPTSWPNTPG